MRIALFCHSLLSDWNHGNAHFLRGIVTELCLRRHEVRVFEPENGWSITNLVAEQGPSPLAAVRRAYPLVNPERYDLAEFDFDRALDGVDVVIVHEWSEPELVAKLGRLRLSGARFRLLFHDTHHRAVTSPESMAAYDLSGYDGVLAFGRALRDVYLDRGFTERAWVWHEAADTRVFHPPGPSDSRQRDRDLVFIGNWGDGERTAELREFVLDPARTLGLTATFHGVRYPEESKRDLAQAGARYDGWLPNFRVPRVFARHRVTVHVPRRPYAAALPGIPTIRVFEALACGIPLVSAPWDDCEGLFNAGSDYLVAMSGAAMKRQLALLLTDPEFAQAVAARGRRTILARHTCAHRVDELMVILADLGLVDRPILRPVSGEAHAP
jgi:spore maturation protein CgeB